MRSCMQRICAYLTGHAFIRVELGAVAEEFPQPLRAVS